MRDAKRRVIHRSHGVSPVRSEIVLDRGERASPPHGRQMRCSPRGSGSGTGVDAAVHHPGSMCRTPFVEIWTWSELRARDSRRALDHRIRRGDLQRIRRGVYASRTACDAAVEAARHGGSLGCESAARHLGIWVLGDGATHVWMRAGRHHHSLDAADCTCTRHWDEGSSASSFALPPVPRILLQIYRCQGAEAFFVALESARRLGLLTSADLRWFSDRIDARGGDLIDFSRDDADSGLESLVRLRTRGHGWTIRTQVRVVGTGRVDLLVDDWLIVEADGKGNHDEPSHRHRDLLRDATAATWGHVTLRFDYAMIVHDWDIVQRAIQAIMRLRPARSEHRFGARRRHPGDEA